MKDRPVVIIVTLLGGAVASICCILRGADLLNTLLIVFLSLFAFMLIGMIANGIFKKMRKEIAERERLEREEREREEAERLEAEKAEKMRLEAEKQEGDDSGQGNEENSDEMPVNTDEDE